MPSLYTLKPPSQAVGLVVCNSPAKRLATIQASEMPILIKSAIFKSTQSSDRIWHVCLPMIFLASLLIKMGAVLSALSNLHQKEDGKLTFTPLYCKKSDILDFLLLLQKPDMA